MAKYFKKVLQEIAGEEVESEEVEEKSAPELEVEEESAPEPESEPVLVKESIPVEERKMAREEYLKHIGLSHRMNSNRAIEAWEKYNEGNWYATVIIV